jgi:hypothetical protein
VHRLVLLYLLLRLALGRRLLLGGGKADAAEKCQRKRAGSQEIASHDRVPFIRRLGYNRAASHGFNSQLRNDRPRCMERDTGSPPASSPQT